MRLIATAAMALIMTTACGHTIGEDIDLEQIVEHYLEASGGREVIEDIRIIHTIDSMFIAGLTGTTESWWIREPFSGRTVIDLGIVRQEILMIGDSVWSVDRNGHLSSGNREELQQADLARKTIFYDAFLDPGNLELLPDTIIDGVTTWPVIITGDTPITVYISGRTWLPVLVTVTVMGMDILQYPSEYTTTDGIISAGRTRDVIPALGHESTSRNIVNEYNCHVPDSIFTTLLGEVDWELPASGQPVPLDLDGEHIYLEGTVCGRDVTILLDSGAGATLIDSVLAVELDLEGLGEFVAQGIGGTQSFSFVSVPEYSAAGASVFEQSLAVMSIDAPFYPFTGRHIGMILGYDFLSRFITLLDYGKNQMTLWNPEEFEYRGNGCVIPVTRTMSLLSVDAMIEDSIPVTLLLDTGAGGNLHLTPAFFEEYPGFTEGRSTFETIAQGVGGEEAIIAFRVDSITLGDYTVPCGISSSFGESPVLSQYHGIIGTGILARFRVYLDYSNSRIILEPSSLFTIGLPVDMTGMRIKIMGENLVVDQVIPGSAAGQAGIQPGDILVSVAGTTVDAAGLNELDVLIPDEEGSTVEIIVRRNGTDISLTVVLQALLPPEQPVTEV